jgi:hypothetical protein
VERAPHVLPTYKETVFWWHQLGPITDDMLAMPPSSCFDNASYQKACCVAHWAPNKPIFHHFHYKAFLQRPDVRFDADEIRDFIVVCYEVYNDEVGLVAKDDIPESGFFHHAVVARDSEIEALNAC